MTRHAELLRQAIELAEQNRDAGGRPFGALLVKDGQVIASAVNRVNQTKDPTTHAELDAIRLASQSLGAADLLGCTVYASSHPCPMCLAALVMTRVEAVYYAFDNQDSAPYGFSSAETYQKLGITLAAPPLPLTKLELGINARELFGSAGE